MAELSIQDRAVEVLARQAVADVSPAELPLFKPTAARYHADPSATMAARRTGGDALGFGVETAVVLVTPFALDLVKRLFTRLSEKLGDTAADSLAGRITALFAHKPATSAPDESEPQPLTSQQLALVSEITRAEAASLALAPAESERLADAVVAALATRS